MGSVSKVVDMKAIDAGCSANRLFPQNIWNVKVIINTSIHWQAVQPKPNSYYVFQSPDAPKQSGFLPSLMFLYHLEMYPHVNHITVVQHGCSLAMNNCGWICFVQM